MLEAQGLSVRYGATCVLQPVSFRVGEGEWLMVAGPNGAGKSTLLNALAQALPYTGRVLLCGRDARAMRPRQRARCLGLLSQSQRMSYAFTVEEVVRLGRYAYTGPLGGMAAQDERAVNEALAFTGMEAYRGHSVLALSGGEVQRAFLAQVLAQEPRVLLLDEPTSHLDIAYQQQIFGLIQTWLKQPGRAAVSVVHDLSLARRYGTRALLLQGGRAVAEGEAAAALGAARLREAYGMDVQGWMRGLLAQWVGDGEPDEPAPPQA